MNGLSSALLQFHFLRPWWLLALPVLLLAAWRWRRRASARPTWADAVDPHLLPYLLECAQPRDARRGWTRGLAWLGAVLAILALAGPAFRKQVQPLWESRQPLVVALDLSQAMQARDLPPTRLAQARAKLARLLRERAGGQVALVAFADDAFTVAPLTDDAANVALFLDALSPDVMPADGQRADRAIAWSQRLLAQAGFAQGEILLMTDHADARAITAAARAASAGYRVSVLGLGSPTGGVYQTPSGLAQARLDAPSLRALALAGGGQYQTLAAGDTDLRALGVLSPARAGAAAAKKSGGLQWRDDGGWLLPLVLLCLLPLFRRGGALAVLMACVLWLPMSPARAQAAAPQAGTLWRRADQLAYARLQAGIAAYRQGDYPRAIEQFSTVPGADAQYNLGNALARAGRYDEAIAAYDRALRLQPGMRDAMENRARVMRARQQQNQQNQQNQQKQQNQQSQQSQQSQQGGSRSSGAQDAGQRQAPPPAPASPESRQAGSPPPPPQTPADAAARQAQADAAQRQRMQEALRRQQGSKPAAAAPAPGQPQETEAQRERRLANAAWLQRVPDDPGALLRARFQLEAQRRREGESP